MIDLFGVCEFGLWYLEIDDVIKVYVEFCFYLGGCKFCDCKYGDDLGCLLCEVVSKGEISVLCFDNYY